MTDPLHRSALELAGDIRLGRTSSEELTRYFLDRIERYNDRLQAFAEVLPRRALWAARRADRALKEPGARPGTFHGVPTGIKDLVPMRGTRTRFGSAAYRYFVSPIDAPAASRMKRGGFVVLGKLATSELGATPITEPAIHPPTRNPFNDAFTPGGSSGGSGSAVAAGLVPIAHGSDGGGSIRIPSAFCHLFGFKPSTMLLGNLHGRVNVLGLSVMGPLALAVDDAAAMLDVLSARPDGPESAGSLLSRSRHRPRPRRILVCTRSVFGPALPEIADAVLATAAKLEQLGHHLEPAEPPDASLEEFLPLWQLQLASVPCPSERSLQPITRWLREAGRRLAIDDVRALQRRLCERIVAFLGDADMLLSPAVPVLPPRVGSVLALTPEQGFETFAQIGAWTAPFNITGQPAASIPAGISDRDGLPYGVQLAGRLDHDAELLAVCRQLEEAMPWRHLRAPGYCD